MTRGLELGADRTCIAEHPGSVKPQLFYLRLKKIGKQIWKETFDVECQPVVGSGALRGDVD